MFSECAVQLAAEPAVVAQSSDDPLTERQLFLVLPVVVAGLALAWAYLTVRDPIERARTVFGIQPFDPDGSVAGDGLHAVSGRVRAGDELTGPVTDEDCVAYGYRDQRYQYGYVHDEERRREIRRMSNVDDERADERAYSWTTVDFEEDAVPFHVETDHGDVAVDPAGAELELPVRADDGAGLLRRFAYVLNPLSGGGNVVIAWLRKLPGMDRLASAQPEREVERNVGVGDEVLVVGDPAEPSADGIGSADDGLGVDESGSVGDGSGVDADGAIAVVADGGDAGLFRVTTRSLWSLKLRSLRDVLRASAVPVAILLLAALVVVAGVYQGAY